jgi:hypothetical protein
MLFLAEGTIHHPVEGVELTAAEAWLGPMVDGGFMQNGYVDSASQRMWLVLSSETRAEADHRLNDLPWVRDGSVSFTTAAVTAVRFR